MSSTIGHIKGVKRVEERDDIHSEWSVGLLTAPS